MWLETETLRAIQDTFDAEITKLGETLDLNSRALEEEIESNRTLQKNECRAIADEIEFFRARRQEEMVHTQHGLDSLQAQMAENEQLVHECLSQVNTMTEDVSKTCHLITSE